jgi:hypothetical protein
MVGLGPLFLVGVDLERYAWALHVSVSDGVGHFLGTVPVLSS